AEQRVPLGPGHAAVVEVGPGELSSMVEEADVVVALLEGLDLRLDEGVDPRQQPADLRRDLEVHVDHHRGRRRLAKGSDRPNRTVGRPWRRYAARRWRCRLRP